MSEEQRETTGKTKVLFGIVKTFEHLFMFRLTCKARISPPAWRQEGTKNVRLRSRRRTANLSFGAVWFPALLASHCCENCLSLLSLIVIVSYCAALLRYRLVGFRMGFRWTVHPEVYPARHRRAQFKQLRWTLRGKTLRAYAELIESHPFCRK
jgi:hypothetical protein